MNPTYNSFKLKDKDMRFSDIDGFLPYKKKMSTPLFRLK
jgi:hypothetical protein